MKKITEKMKREILVEIMSDIPDDLIAEEFGISIASIRKIRIDNNLAYAQFYRIRFDSFCTTLDFRILSH